MIQCLSNKWRQEEVDRQKETQNGDMIKIEERNKGDQTEMGFEQRGCEEATYKRLSQKNPDKLCGERRGAGFSR